MVDRGERLFLLEVFVDNVHLDLHLQERTQMKTCVKFKLLNYPFLEILEDEYCKVAEGGSNIKFQSGKSCLFSLRKNPQGCKKPPFSLSVNVVRVEVNGGTQSYVGKTSINLSGSFTNLIQEAGQKPDNNPVSKIIKETYRLVDEKGQNVGNISVFVRLSCFGKIIVTQFQMSGLESKSFLFKAVSDIRGKQFEGCGDAGVYDSSIQQNSSLNVCHQSNWNSGIGPCMRAESNIPPPPPSTMFNPPMYPNQPMMAPPGMMYPPYMIGPPFTSGMPEQFTSGTMPGNISQQYVQPYPPPMNVASQENADYKNFSATVNGHVLNIKVLRKPKKLKKPEAIFCQNIPICHSSSSEESIVKPKKKETTKPKSTPVQPRLPLCDCDMPIPPCLIAPPSPVSEPPKIKKKKKSKCPRDTGMFCQPGCPLGFPTPPALEPTSYGVSNFGGSPTATGDQQNFFITMEPRTDYHPPIQPPKPRCITVRSTQYENDDFGAQPKISSVKKVPAPKKGAKGKAKGKGKKKK